MELQVRRFFKLSSFLSSFLFFSFIPFVYMISLSMHLFLSDGTTGLCFYFSEFPLFCLLFFLFCFFHLLFHLILFFGIALHFFFLLLLRSFFLFSSNFIFFSKAIIRKYRSSKNGKRRASYHLSKWLDSLRKCLWTSHHEFCLDMFQGKKGKPTKIEEKGTMKKEK